MTQEDKELLLQDLCARLPYGVKCRYNCVIPGERIAIAITNAVGELTGIEPMLGGHIGFRVGGDKINAFEGDIKPFLRPLSSMTEDEKEELKQVALVDNEGVPGDIPAYIDWLNKKMFDYRGLIPMGLALEAPEGMYN